ncbi:MAG: translation initiation factor IF-3 [Clostridia bacterium]|nr:translation initiation factor IF-3 [Clostridia bacterium]
MLCGDRNAVFAFFYFKWRCLAISTKELQINEQIRANEVRLIGADGEQVGIVKLAQAQDMAEQKGLDLVMISPNAEPPVCRIMDYGKYRFERIKKEKEARKNQQIVKVKEIQLSCTIDTHDFETRVNHALRFLADGNKVKVIVKFKGREMSHLDNGREVIARFLAACAEAGSTDKKPTLEGRSMSVILSPIKN